MDNLEGLVKKIKAHGPDTDSAFQDLYEATNRSALAVIRRYCDIEEDYEDILQETYIRVYRSIYSLKDDTKALAWVRRIAGNTAIRHNMKRRPQMFSEMEDEEGNIPDFEDTSGIYDPSAVVDQKVVSQAVAQVLDSLPLDQRTAIWRVYGQQMTIREVAEELGISENTIKSRLYQARQKLLARKDEFRKLGVDLTVVPIAILVAVAFEDTVYAVPLVAGTAAADKSSRKKPRADAGTSSETGGKTSGVDQAKTAGNAVGKAAKTAGSLGTGAAKTAGAAGAKATIGLGAIGKASLAVKITVAAVAAVAVIGGGAAVAVSHAAPYMEPIDTKLEAYNNRSYGLKETLDTYYPDEVLGSVEKTLKSGNTSMDEMYLDYWNGDTTFMESYVLADMMTYDSQFGDDWKISWKKVKAEKLEEGVLETFRSRYKGNPLQMDPKAQLEVVLSSHSDERKELYESLRDMKITEGYQVAVQLTIKGSKGQAKEDKGAVVLKQGGDWVLCNTEPYDLVYAITFQHKEDTHGDDDDAAEAAAEVKGDGAQEDGEGTNASRADKSETGSGENIAMARTSKAANVLEEFDLDEINNLPEKDENGNSFTIDGKDNLNFLIGNMVYISTNQLFAPNQQNVKEWAGKLYGGDWETLTKLLDAFSAYDLDPIMSGLDVGSPESVTPPGNTEASEGDSYTAAQLEYLASAITGTEWKLNSLEDCQSDEVLIDGDRAILLDYEGEYSESAFELQSPRIRYAGDGEWVIQYDFMLANHWSEPVTKAGEFAFSVKENPDSCFDGYSVTGIKAEISKERDASDETSTEQNPSATIASDPRYENEKNMAAVAAYQDALNNNSQYQSTSILPDEATEFSLLDLNDDGVYEMILFVPGSSNATTHNYFLYYTNKLHEGPEMLRGNVFVIPEEGIVCSVLAQMGFSMNTFMFDGNGTRNENSYSYVEKELFPGELNPEYEGLSEEGRAENDRNIEITNALLDRATDLDWVKATQENISLYLSGPGAATSQTAGGENGSSSSSMGNNQNSEGSAPLNIDLDTEIQNIRATYAYTNGKIGGYSIVEGYPDGGGKGKSYINSNGDMAKHEEEVNSLTAEIYYANTENGGKAGGSAKDSAIFCFAHGNGQEYRLYFNSGKLIRYIGPDGITMDYSSGLSYDKAEAELSGYSGGENVGAILSVIAAGAK